MKNFPLLFFLSLAVLLHGCSSSRFIDKKAQQLIFKQTDLESAHVGISVYDVASHSFLYDHQGDKFFVPASNTKLFSLYAGLKYLGDSLTGIRYLERDTDILILPTGDPTLLHPDYLSQPVIDFLKSKKRNIYIDDANWQDR